MKINIFFSICLFISSLGIAQNEQETILSINDKSFKAEDFLHVYNKNKDLAEKIDPKTVDEYMDLFVNFKLKVYDAETLGYDTIPTFINEYAGYKEQITKNYLYNKELEDKFITEAYDRLKKQVRASHILIQVKQKATPEDTAKAYNKALDILKEIKSGEDFTKIAKKNSEDPSVHKNGGDLGFFSVLQMVYPFETAVFNANKGDVVGPVRTRFGYHVLKVTDVRKNPGERKVAHILLRKKKVENNSGLKTKINEVYKKLNAGEKFSELAKLYSDDKKSARIGGNLPWISRNGQMVAEFEDQVFALKNKKELSKPFETIYGWHILKLIDVKEIGSFATEKNQLKRKISNNDRSKAKDLEMILNLAKEYNYTIYPSNVKKIESVYLSKDFAKKDWKGNSKLNKAVIKFADKTFTQQQFLNYLHTFKTELSFSKNKSKLVDQKLKEYGEKELMAYEKTQLIHKFPEYRLLLDEYKDGMLLYEISRDLIWDKALKDTNGLKEFYSNNIDDYKWKERVEATIYTCESKKVAKKSLKLLKANKDLDAVKKIINKKSALALDSKSGVYSSGDNQVIDSFKKTKGFSDIQKVNNKYCFVYINAIKPVEVKSLKDAKGSVVSDYQKHLEKNWLSSLKKKNNVQINQEVLNAIKDKLKK